MVRSLTLCFALALGSFAAAQTPDGGAVPTSSADAADTATQYLNAWSYRDYATMYALTAEPTRKALPENAFYAGAGKLPVINAAPQIISRSPRPLSLGGGETIYFEIPGLEKADAPLRGSLTVTPTGIIHPELVAHAPQGGVTAVAAPSGSTATAPEAQNVDGLTVDQIMENTQKALNEAKTMRADVNIKGSMMGTSMNDQGKMIAMAPNKVRLETGQFVLNSDGQKTMLYLPAGNMVIDLAQLGGKFELAPGFGTSIEEMKSKYQMSLVGKDAIDGKPAYKLRLKPPSGMSGLMGMASGGDITMWIDAASWLPVRSDTQGIVIDFDGMKTNVEDVTEATFKWQPPQNANELNLGSLLGGMGAGAGGLPPAE